MRGEAYKRTTKPSPRLVIDRGERVSRGIGLERTGGIDLQDYDSEQVIIS